MEGPIPGLSSELLSTFWNVSHHHQLTLGTWLLPNNHHGAGSCSSMTLPVGRVSVYLGILRWIKIMRLFLFSVTSEAIKKFHAAYSLKSGLLRNMKLAYQLWLEKSANEKIGQSSGELIKA